MIFQLSSVFKKRGILSSLVEDIPDWDYNLFMHALHELEPVYDSFSRVLILGSFPSVKSREAGFYYAHKSNRFWPVISSLFSVELDSVEKKLSFLHAHHIALWDVIASCDIDSSSDASIRMVIPNDISMILERTRVERIYVNGGKAYELYQRMLEKKTGREAVRLPSTSSANASYSLDRLITEYSVIKAFLDSFSD